MKFDIIESQKGNKLRQKFIDEHIDKTRDYYHLYIKSPSKFESGNYYDGYLWDCLKDNLAWEYHCSIMSAMDFLRNKSDVLVMWDLFSSNRVLMRRMLSQKYPINTVIKANGDNLVKQIEFEWTSDLNSDDLLLPEDIYCFDESMNWYVIFTHEIIDNSECEDNRVCFMKKQIFG